MLVGRSGARLPALATLAQERDDEALYDLYMGAMRFDHFSDYALSEIREQPARLPSGIEAMAPDGHDVAARLHEWHSARNTRPKYDFVVSSLRRAFPDAFADLDFTISGQAITMRLYRPGDDEALPFDTAPNGLVAGLVHLAAVASGDGVVALDEFENSLHPYAIRTLIDCIRGWSSDHGLTVVLSTHSPVVLDEFRHCPEQVWVMDPAADVLPVRLTDLEDSAWLAHFSLGDLYAREEFGAPALAHDSGET